MSRCRREMMRGLRYKIIDASKNILKDGFKNHRKAETELGLLQALYPDRRLAIRGYVA